jgi:predicted 3-demethylubiquinone-9 3-methyltransferase (glyoxalase superfamily)
MALTLQRITPFLWFNDQAEEAVKFYTSVFENSKVKNITRYGETGPRPKGSIMTISFDLAGQEFIALNGGPIFKFTEAISFVVNCDSQKEVDFFWEKLSEGGSEVECGWLKDKYGLSWQVVPKSFLEMLSGDDAAAIERMMTAMFQMKKLDLAVLEKAYRQG